ncbi:MAG: mandelate racemase/muconate lactonizing enzyme family protein [Dehalococcoidia bacterium]|nr:MAG: mandelate racemase/muconate lactonizing enzyme family protein [Chloroflexota bacterium]|tara:strand:+ start:893 stop:2191 length:1299 start_codon:yes stop_codon:yes gene_type:complete
MKIVNIESFPIRVSNNSDKGRKINTKNINTAMLANTELSDKSDSYNNSKNKSETKRHLEIKSMDSYETIIKDMGEYYIDEGSNTSIYSKSHETTVVKIETDTGIIGWGEAQSPVSPNTSATIIKDIVTPLTIGKNIFDVEAIWHKNYSAKRERGHYTGFYIDAICGVDIAIWDAIGKALNMSTAQAMGGIHRNNVPLYNGIGGTIPEEVADQAEWSVGKGYKYLKMHLKEDLDKTIEIVTKVRERVGESIGLMLDVHMGFDTFNAIKLGKELEKINLLWLESPSDPIDIPGLCEISRSLDLPIANGEWTRTKYEMREIFEKKAYDISMPDIARTGLTGGKQIATIAELYNIPVSPHVGGGGIVSIAATLQYSMTIPNFLIMEHSEQGHAVKSMILSENFDAKQGTYNSPIKPGLGIEIDENKLEKYKIKPSL